VRRTLNAYMEDAKVARTSSRWCDIPRSVTPSTWMVLTSVAFAGIMRGGGDGYPALRCMPIVFCLRNSILVSVTMLLYTQAYIL